MHKSDCDLIQHVLSAAKIADQTTDADVSVFITDKFLHVVDHTQAKNHVMIFRYCPRCGQEQDPAQ